MTADTSADPRLTVTGRTVRYLLAAATAALLVAVVAGTGFRVGGVALLLLLLSPLGIARFADSGLPTIVCAVAAVIYLVAGAPLGWRLVPVAALLHTVHVLAGVAEAVPLGARAEPQALAPTLRRWATTMAVTVPALAVVALLAA